MDFTYVMESVIKALDSVGIRYALIGGFAMALRGVQRATIDLDFILMMEDLDLADEIFIKSGYQRNFRSENVSHYESSTRELGRIDILHAFRGPTLSMLDRADRIPISAHMDIPVVQVEDLIGLKIQAASNDPLRHVADWSDIRLLVQSSGQKMHKLDWDLISDYLELFNQKEELVSLKEWYGTSHRK